MPKILEIKMTVLRSVFAASVVAFVIPLVTAVPLAGAQSRQQWESNQKRNIQICNKALYNNKTITAKILKSCNATSAPSKECDTGPAVYWFSINNSGDTAELRTGYKPMVYTNKNFSFSTIDQLCGDSVPAGLTPAAPPMTQKQVRSAIKAAGSLSK